MQNPECEPQCPQCIENCTCNDVTHRWYPENQHGHIIETQVDDLDQDSAEGDLFC